MKNKWIGYWHQLKPAYVKARQARTLALKNKRRALNGLPPKTAYKDI